MDSLDLDDAMMRRKIAIQRIMDLRNRLKRDNIPAKIEEGLFLGSLEAANNMCQRKRLNITHLLTVAVFPQPLFSKDVNWMGINIRDNKAEDIRQHFEQCFEFIDGAKEAGGAVLVHCIVGKSRSVTVVVAYLMKKHGMSLSQALELVKSKRPIACPNGGFIAQLEKFEKSLLALKEKESA